MSLCFSRILGFIPIFFVVSLSQAIAQTNLENPAFSKESFKAAIHQLSPLSFHPGLNNVFFAGIGKSGQITVAYTQYGTPGSHNLFLVTVPADDASQNGSWLTVPVGDNEDEVTKDAPNDGTLVGKYVEFCNGTMNGKPVTLLFIASIRHIMENGSGVAQIEVDELKPQLDLPPYAFQPILHFTTAVAYGSAKEALVAELGIR
jgi:hypothetical protein